MADISQTIIAKSDQLNAQDLIAGPVTINIVDVAVNTKSDQPVAIKSDGCLQPYKPCKSMRRLLASIWGTETSDWIGRKLTLYLDPSVTWAGAEVGGIRISHASHIDGKLSIQLRANRHTVVTHEVMPIKNGDESASDLNKLNGIITAFEKYGLTSGDVYSYIGITDGELVTTDDAAKMMNLGISIKNGKITPEEIKRGNEQ